MAFDPVHDARGEVVGLVLATRPVAELRGLLNAALWRNIGILALLFGVTAVVLFTSVGRWLARQEHAQHRLVQRHAGVTDSIAYAGKIQRALVPDPSVYAERFRDHFVLDRPKDVVSGDFHWFHRIDDDQCFVAAADCTGHGLPGAMMAAIGCSLLNELVAAHADADPGELLARLSERMVHALHQQGSTKGAGDGMDIALCRVDRRRQEILFAGAFRPLYWLHQGQLSVINGDRMPIGGAQHGSGRRFTTHRIAYHPGDRIYLFRDGYVDQFGGPERRKFMAHRLNALIVGNQHLPLARQADVLEQAFLDWKGDLEQLDDVCLIGLEV
jgi:serine phosphatase RsbU (regulator of sigma subunit)